jgi:hypothetical protein
MTIRASQATEIRGLLDGLASGDEVRRESAIARLAIIGERAVDRLIETYASGDRPTRIAILRTAEAIADPRSSPVAAEALGGGGDLAVAGASALRALLESPNETAAARALDALVAAALDRGAERRVRVAAFDALSELPATVRQPIAEALRDDPDGALHQQATAVSRETAAVDAAWQDALEERLPDDPAVLREAVKARAGSTPLGSLQKLVDAIRLREAEAGVDRAGEWQQVRGAIHQALALRGSRVAVYDLRETLETASAALPPTFMAALHAVGDESCLEPIATAWDGSTDEVWRHQLQAAFAAIVNREKLTRRSPVLKRISTRWPTLTPAFAKASTSAPRATVDKPTGRRRT